MNFCKACGKNVHETASSCPHCGAVQIPLIPKALSTSSSGPIWTSITALVLGTLPILSMFAPAEWTPEQAIGAAMFATGALVFGGISVAKHHRGRGMAIAALVMGVIGLLAAISAGI